MGKAPQFDNQLGVLLSGQPDDGNGLARLKILNHKHEMLTGVTSSLTFRVH